MNCISEISERGPAKNFRKRIYYFLSLPQIQFKKNEKRKTVQIVLFKGRENVSYSLSFWFVKLKV